MNALPTQLASATLGIEAAALAGRHATPLSPDHISSTARGFAQSAPAALGAFAGALLAVSAREGEPNFRAVIHALFSHWAAAERHPYDPSTVQSPLQVACGWIKAGVAVAAFESGADPEGMAARLATEVDAYLDARPNWRYCARELLRFDRDAGAPDAAALAQAMAAALPPRMAKSPRPA